MSQRHLMSRIEATYGLDMTRAAKHYAPIGTDWRDLYGEILLVIHDRVRRRRLPLRSEAAMRVNIKQRAIEIIRKELLYKKRHTVKVVSETARCSESQLTPERMRTEELKVRILRSLPALDARIVMELAFPSSGAQKLARHRPTREGPILRKVNKGMTPVVRKWHVAKLLGVSDARVAQATRTAKEVVGYVIEEEGNVKDGKTVCQICSCTEVCRLVRCDTSRLHPEGRKLTGKQGTAMLSVCRHCERVDGKGAGS